METLIRQWDGESVIVKYDRPTGAWIFIAIHSTQQGPTGGGTRMRTYPDPASALSDALKLGAAMTYKFAAADLAHGGAKAVIARPPSLDEQQRRDLLRRYGQLVHQLGGLFYTGPDVGTSSADMDIVAETGAPYILGRTPQAGGSGESGLPTALGVFEAMRTACDWLFGRSSVAGRKVLVQGVGNVGAALIERLRGASARVLFSDVEPTVVRRFRAEPDLTFIPADQVYETECDIFAPCALGGILNETTIPHLRCRAVIGSANNQLAAQEDARRLQMRNILYGPDFVVNAGGAIGVIAMEELGYSQAEAERRVSDTVTRTLAEVFHLAEAAGIDTDAAARRIADQRLARSSLEPVMVTD